MGFIAYQLLEQSAVRIFMECEDEGNAVSYTYAVEVQFNSEAPACRLSGVDSILALKKFYKLVFSLEERAREHSGDWRSVFSSLTKLIEHLDYTRNIRKVSPGLVLRVRKADQESEPLDQQQLRRQ